MSWYTESLFREEVADGRQDVFWIDCQWSVLGRFGLGGADDVRKANCRKWVGRFVLFSMQHDDMSTMPAI